MNYTRIWQRNGGSLSDLAPTWYTQDTVRLPQIKTSPLGSGVSLGTLGSPPFSKKRSEGHYTVHPKVYEAF